MVKRLFRARQRDLFAIAIASKCVDRHQPAIPQFRDVTKIAAVVDKRGPNDSLSGHGSE